MQIGFLPLLTLVFVVAKLFGAITWSWWVVFSPMLVGVPVVLLFAVILMLIAYAVNK